MSWSPVLEPHFGVVSCAPLQDLLPSACQGKGAVPLLLGLPSELGGSEEYCGDL